MSAPQDYDAKQYIQDKFDAVERRATMASDCEVAVCVKWSGKERLFNVRVRIVHTFTAEGM